MPYFEVLLYGERVTKEQKEHLSRGVSEAAEQVLGLARKQVRVGIQDWPTENGFDGAEAGEHEASSTGQGGPNQGL